MAAAGAVPSADQARRIFIAAPADLADERARAVRLIEEIAGDAPGDPIRPFAYEYEDMVWDPGTHWQLQLPQPGRDRFDLLVCLFGERLGNPLPDDGMLEFPLDDAVDYGGSEGRFPLTGTLFEYFEALHSYRQTGFPKLLLYFKGDDSVADLRRSGEERNWGGGALYRRLEEETAHRRGFTRGLPDAVHRLYRQQVEWLTSFFEWQRESPHNGLFLDWKDLAPRLEGDLRTLLGLRKPLSRRAGKHLHYFDVHDRDLLFGRREDLRELVAKLRTATNAIPLLVLYGRSGSGKSSLLRAGLAGRLEDGSFRASVGAQFLSCVVAPADLDGDPFAALWRVLQQREDNLADVSNLSGAVQALSKALAGRRLFLAVDQFEEALAAPFADGWTKVIELLCRVAQSGLGFSAVAVRAEWMQAWREHPVVRAATQAHRIHEEELTHSLTRTAAVEIIRGSFEAAGFVIHPELLDHVWRELQQLESHSEAALPLLSVAISNLEEAWKRNSDRQPFGSPRVLDASYRDVATLRSVIGELGDACLSETRTTVDHLQRVLRALVATTFDDVSHRRTLVSRNCDDFGPEDQPLLHELARRRLAILDHGRIRLTHDAVIENWDNAHQWWEKERLHLEVRTDVHLLMRTGAELPPQLLDRAERMIVDWRDVPGTSPSSDVGLYVRQYMRRLFDPQTPLTGDGELRLADAIRLNDLDLVTHMLLCGADVNLPSPHKDRNAATPLMTAASNGQVAIVDVLLQHGAKVDMTDAHGYQALAYAAHWGRLPVAERLLAAGGDPLHQAEGGDTALMGAATRGHIDVAALLAAIPAALEQLDDEGRSALGFAIQPDRPSDVARLLISRGARIDDVIVRLAAAFGDGALMEELIARGIDPTAWVEGHLLPVVIAAEHGRLDVVDVLLRHARVRIDTPDRSGRTALSAALFRGHGELVRRLTTETVDLPFWYARSAADEIRRRTRDELRPLLEWQLAEASDRDWPVPPILGGDWSSVAAAEAADILSEALATVPLDRFGTGFSRIDAMRRRDLSFYEGATLFEGRAKRDDEFAGYLTFVRHPLGIWLLDGSSPPIHEMNARFGLRIEDQGRAADYLRFFCSAIQSEFGSFTVLEDASRLMWDEPPGPHLQKSIALLVHPAQLTPTADGQSWSAHVIEHYGWSLFRSELQISASGMVEMTFDQNALTWLPAKCEAFVGGLRTLVDVPAGAHISWLADVPPGRKMANLLDRFVRLHGASWTWDLRTLDVMAAVAATPRVRLEEALAALPWEPSSSEALMAQLAAAGWVVITEVGGERYVECPSEKLEEMYETMGALKTFEQLRVLAENARSFLDGGSLMDLRIVAEVDIREKEGDGGDLLDCFTKAERSVADVSWENLTRRGIIESGEE